jgi:hypothetical protein
MWCKVVNRPVPNSPRSRAALCLYVDNDPATEAWLCLPYEFSATDRAVTNAKIAAEVTARLGDSATIGRVYQNYQALGGALSARAAAGRVPHGPLWRATTWSVVAESGGGIVTQSWYVDAETPTAWHSEARRAVATVPTPQVLRALDARSLHVGRVYLRGIAIAASIRLGALDGIPLDTRFELPA